MTLLPAALDGTAEDCGCKVLPDCNGRTGCKHFSYAASLATAIEDCRVTCKHEPSGFDLEQQGYEVLIKALRAYASMGGY